MSRLRAHLELQEPSQGAAGMEGADVDQAAAQSPATKRSGRERLRVLTRERAVGPWLPPDAVQASDGRIQTERPAQPLVQGKRSARLARRDPRTSNRGTQRVCEQASRPVCVMRVEPCSPETHKDAEAPFRQASLRTGLPRGRGMHSATQTSCRSGTGATEKLGPWASGFWEDTWIRGGWKARTGGGLGAGVSSRANPLPYSQFYQQL